MASANVIEVTAETWEQEVVKSDKPVLVDFWAVYCGPCRRMLPTIEKVADDFAGKVKVVKLNIEDVPDVATKHRALTLPQLMVLKDCEEVERPSPGVKSEADIVKMLNRVLGA